MIALLSVENTGTHFTASVLRHLTGKSSEWAAPVNPNAFQTENIGIFVQHVYPVGFSSHSDGVVELMLRADQVVVPMRDPIRALISNHDRGHGNLPYRKHVESFERVSEWLHAPNVHFFRVDVAPDNRWAEVAGLAWHLRMDPPNEEAPDWRPENVTPQRHHSVLRTWYHEGEWSKLDEALDGAITALEPLSEFFEMFGYEVPCLPSRA